MFIKATKRHDETIIYFNVDKIISIEPSDYMNAKSTVKCDCDANKDWHYVLETPEELIAQTKRKKI
jgi:hypothetical protein